MRLAYSPSRQDLINESLQTDLIDFMRQLANNGTLQIESAYIDEVISKYEAIRVDFAEDLRDKLDDLADALKRARGIRHDLRSQAFESFAAALLGTMGVDAKTVAKETDVNRLLGKIVSRIRDVYNRHRKKDDLLFRFRHSDPTRILNALELSLAEISLGGTPATLDDVMELVKQAVDNLSIPWLLQNDRDGALNAPQQI